MYSKLERTAAAHDKQQRKNITASLAATPSSLTINHIFCLQDINKYAAEHIRNLAQHIKPNVLQLVLLKYLNDV